MRFVVLGSTGMLGSELVRVARLSGLEVLATSREQEPRFDAFRQPFLDFAKQIELSEQDFVVNAIGWIPQKASGDVLVDRRDAYLLNNSLLADLSSAQKIVGFRWLQIGTDCVFSGKLGRYSETSFKDAGDLYGQSKIEGESHCTSSILVRSSIIGPDKRSNAGLYAWFKSQQGKTAIPGYQNHLWNGVTTTAFARLAAGLAKSEVSQMCQHWLPSDVVSKAQLLSLFAENLGFADDAVEATENPLEVNRSLITNNQEQNRQLWRLAGYDGVPRISELVSEMVEVDLGRR